MDLYLGFAYLGLTQLPLMICPEITLVRPDSQLQSLSLGFVPWRREVTDVNENLYRDQPTEILSPGLYNLYLLATPAGQLRSDFYLWRTSFYSAIPAFIL